MDKLTLFLENQVSGTRLLLRSDNTEFVWRRTPTGWRGDTKGSLRSPADTAIHIRNYQFEILAVFSPDAIRAFSPLRFVQGGFDD